MHPVYLPFEERQLQNVHLFLFLMMWISAFPFVVWAIVTGSTIHLVTGAIQLDFRVTPSVVQPLETRNVKLQCLVNEVTSYQSSSYYYNQLGQYVLKPNSPPSSEDKSGLVVIRILKNLQTQWQAIAQISSVAPTDVHKLDTTINTTEGVISGDPTKRSFLQVSWDLATSDAFGSYRCDAISFDDKQSAILTTSSELSLGSSLNALDFLRLLKHDMTSMRELISLSEQVQSLGRNVTDQMRSELQTLKNKTEGKETELEENLFEQLRLLRIDIWKIENKIGYIERELANTMEEVRSKIGVILDSGFLMLWPQGSYGLLQPQSGCPVGGGTTWESGWVRHHTESTNRNKDELSTETHLKEPVLEKVGGNNFLTQRFCMKTSANVLGPNWPKGSYCINKKGNCPDRFSEGSVRWDEENDVTIRTSGGSLPDGILSSLGVTTVLYCCRQDGAADVPIYLPNSDPFYLYRYGGKCQQVHGTILTNEFVLFDTENNGNNDKLGTVHPDGTINNVRLELCYYTKK